MTPGVFIIHAQQSRLVSWSLPLRGSRGGVMQMWCAGCRRMMLIRWPKFCYLSLESKVIKQPSTTTIAIFASNSVHHSVHWTLDYLISHLDRIYLCHKCWTMFKWIKVWKITDFLLIIHEVSTLWAARLINLVFISDSNKQTKARSDLETRESLLFV